LLTCAITDLFSREHYTAEEACAIIQKTKG
jgi:hypothetical protein